MNRPPARLLAGALAVAALPATIARADDLRLATRVYDDAEVVKIEGKLGVQTTIGFGESESIENVAVGDVEKWQITPNKRADLLFVKPLEANARTNMTVVTDKHTYFFDLVASPGATPVYMLRFTYGARTDRAAAGFETAFATIAQGPGAAPGSDRRTPSAPPSGNAIDPAMLNFAWERKGYEKLGPARIYDDGISTYLLFGLEQDIPAILVRGADGDEKPAEFEKRGNTIVVASVPREIVLKGARASLTLRNLRDASPAVAAPPAPTAVAEAAGTERTGALAN